MRMGERVGMGGGGGGGREPALSSVAVRMFSNCLYVPPPSFCRGNRKNTDFSKLVFPQNVPRLSDVFT